MAGRVTLADLKSTLGTALSPSTWYINDPRAQSGGNLHVSTTTERGREVVADANDRQAGAFTEKRFVGNMTIFLTLGDAAKLDALSAKGSQEITVAADRKPGFFNALGGTEVQATDKKVQRPLSLDPGTLASFDTATEQGKKDLARYQQDLAALVATGQKRTVSMEQSGTVVHYRIEDPNSACRPPDPAPQKPEVAPPPPEQPRVASVQTRRAPHATKRRATVTQRPKPQGAEQSAARKPANTDAQHDKLLAAMADVVSRERLMTAIEERVRNDTEEPAKPSRDLLLIAGR